MTTIQGTSPLIDEECAAALARFRARYGADLRFAPILVVIAALDEEDSLGEVLDHIAPSVAGIPVDVLVVDDGSEDATAEVAARYPDVRVVSFARNLGHGVALRMGYRLAAEHGARYVVTLDADMQWDPREMDTVLEPLLAGEADFVIGSRVLGKAETDDAFRHAGVHVFATLVTLLTGVKVTDTSSGYRAMRTEVTQQVPQTQVQYQTSELLIGAIYHGFRVAERPITMHQRFSGQSKKGHNLLYGFRYARVVLGTWLREHNAARRRGELPERPRLTRAIGLARAVFYPCALALVAIMGLHAVQGANLSDLGYGPLLLSFAPALAWWLCLALGWSFLAGEAGHRSVMATWCRTQVARYVPGAIWAVVARATTVHGRLRDKLTAVTAENVVVCLVALAVGGAWAGVEDARWLPLALLVLVPLLASRWLERRTRISRGRVRRTSITYVAGYASYGVMGVLVQWAVSGGSTVHQAWYVAGASCVAWAIGLVVVIAPGGVGVREVVYVWLLSGLFPMGQLEAAAVVSRLVTVFAELAVLAVIAWPARRSAREAAREAALEKAGERPLGEREDEPELGS
ncbi:MAG TPA: glycosyltransferase family 2 protein [Marmoricola sp.]|nr:glycosyltransferase family 2 protein [Marmoricola sp.]